MDEVVEISEFRHTKDEYRHALPYAIYFVYTEDGREIHVKGMSDEVKKYVYRHYPRSFYAYTYWKKGECRGGWGSPMRIYMMPRQIDNRLRYEISITTKTGHKTIAKVRRVPRRWLKEYSEAQEK